MCVESKGHVFFICASGYVRVIHIYLHQARAVLNPLLPSFSNTTDKKTCLKVHLMVIFYALLFNILYGYDSVGKGT